MSKCHSTRFDQIKPQLATMKSSQIKNLFRFLPQILITLVTLFWLLTACNPPLDYLQVSGGVLFQDDFSHPIANWKQANSPQAASEYRDDSYILSIQQPYLRAVSHPGLNFSNVQIEVDAHPLSGSAQNLYGIICRYQNDKNYYALMISSDSYYGIFANVEGKFGLIGVELMSVSNIIHPMPDLNHLSAKCSGDQLSLAVNGVPLTTQRDNHFYQGDIGLLAGTLEEASIEVQFDNLCVIKP